MTKDKFILYKVYKNLENDLENKANKTPGDIAKLASVKAEIGTIEIWAKQKMLTDLYWTTEEILLRYGHQPTLIIEFHPSSNGYMTFRKEVAGNVEFSQDELVELLTNIQNKVARKAGQIKF